MRRRRNLRPISTTQSFQAITSTLPPLLGFAPRQTFCYVARMRHYPAFLDPSRLSCLVVGAGDVGLRKIGTLVDCGVADILILDLAEPSQGVREYLPLPSVRFERRGFEPADLDGRSLAFACTPVREVNERVGRLARERGVLVNVADAPQESTFVVPATLSRGPLTVALSTGGASPAVARRIRMELEDYFGPRYGLFLTLMERIRPLVLGLGRPTADNTAVFRALAASALPDALAADDAAMAAQELARLLPPELAPRATELLDGLDESY